MAEVQGGQTQLLPCALLLRVASRDWADESLLDFRLCRVIWLTLFLTQGGSVSHARSWANREALPACGTYLTA